MCYIDVKQLVDMCAHRKTRCSTRDLWYMGCYMRLDERHDGKSKDEEYEVPPWGYKRESIDVRTLMRRVSMGMVRWG